MPSVAVIIPNDVDALDPFGEAKLTIFSTLKNSLRNSAEMRSFIGIRLRKCAKQSDVEESNA